MRLPAAAFYIPLMQPSTWKCCSPSLEPSFPNGFLLGLDSFAFFAPKRSTADIARMEELGRPIYFDAQSSDLRGDWWRSLLSTDNEEAQCPEDHSGFSGRTLGDNQPRNVDDEFIYANLPQAVFIERFPSSPTVETDRTVIFMHGSGDDLESIAHLLPSESDTPSLAQMLADVLQARVLIPEYPGYSLLRFRHGWRYPSQRAGLVTSRALLRYLIHCEKLSASNLMIIGNSIGSGMATDMVFGLEQAYKWSQELNRPDDMTARLKLAGFSLVAPFTSLRSAVCETIKVPSVVSNLISNDLDNLSKIVFIKVPTLYIHGLADNFLNATNSRRLMQEQRKSYHDVQIELIEGMDHDHIMKNKDASYAALKAFGHRVFQA